MIPPPNIIFEILVSKILFSYYFQKKHPIMVGLLIKLGYLFLIVVAGVTGWFIEEMKENVLVLVALALIAVVVGLVIVFTPKMFPYSTGAEKIE